MDSEKLSDVPERGSRGPAPQPDAIRRGDRIGLRFPPGQGAAIKGAADALGESVNGWATSVLLDAAARVLGEETDNPAPPD